VQPRISVIIPTYNRSALVRECVGSLLSSGVDGLEVVVADDGSTDDTEAVARSIPNVVYVRQQNAGPAAARNTGFEVSRGRYVCFLDSDDEWIPGGPERLVTQLDANPDIPAIFADTSMGSPTSGFVSFVGTYGGDAFEHLPHTERPGGIRVFETSAFFRQLSTRNVMFLGSLLVRRDVFSALGGFDASLRGAADWEFFMRLTTRFGVAYSSGPPVSVYLKHDEGMSTDVDHMEKDFILALESVRRACPLGPEERAHIDEQLRRHLFGWAYLAYEKNDFRAMRKRLVWAFALGQGRSREALFLALSLFPSGFVGLMRAGRRALFAS
jgi:glycosyltransferase involved in cell wall biosynthesis